MKGLITNIKRFINFYTKIFNCGYFNIDYVNLFIVIFII